MAKKGSPDKQDCGDSRNGCVSLRAARESIDRQLGELKHDIEQLQGFVLSLQETRAELRGKASQGSVYMAVALAIASLIVQIGRAILAR